MRFDNGTELGVRIVGVSNPDIYILEIDYANEWRVVAVADQPESFKTLNVMEERGDILVEQDGRRWIGWELRINGLKKLPAPQ